MTESPADRTDPTPYTPDPPAVDVLVEELVQRLRPVLDGMPEREFLHLVRAIARRRHRWDQEARTHGP